MGFRDLILFPIYVYLFHLLFSVTRKKLKDPILKKYHLIGFWVKVFATICISIFNVYISVGDSTTLYYPEGLNLFRLILHNPDHLQWLFVDGKNFDLTLAGNPYTEGYYASNANFLIIKLVAVLSFFTFGTYSVINLCFSMIAFSGIWKLFCFFYELSPTLHKQLSFAILFFPTVVFWSSGVLKDPICMGMLGWLTYSSFQIIVRKRNLIQNTIILIVAIYTLAVVKEYILYAYFPFFILYIMLTQVISLKSIFLRAMTLMVISVCLIIGFTLASESLKNEMSFFAIDNLAGSVEYQQKNFIHMSDVAESSFSLGVEYDGTPMGLLKIAPAAVNATLFRPYIWESKKISTLLSSLESMSLMFFTLFVFFKSGVFRFFKIIFNSPMISFCLFFSLLFALFIGATTLNFGTLVRYKIPCLPFYLIALILINQKRLQLIATKKLPVKVT